MTERQIQALERLLGGLGRVRIAVSGGVDSMTLAILAGRTAGSRPVIYHALSPAVPPVCQNSTVSSWENFPF